MGLAVGPISATWSLQQVTRTRCGTRIGGSLALVQLRILALPGEARKCPGRTSGQLKKVGVLLY